MAFYDGHRNDPPSGLGYRSHGSMNYLPLVSLSAHTSILSSVSRTKLTQTFTNPWPTQTIPELRYTFPLYDGVSVVGFTCTINNDRVIRGVVKEKQAARQTFHDAVLRGESAGLLEALPEASDVFTTTIGNVPPDAEIRVEIIVLGELKHDAEVDGIRLTLPTLIAPRYGAMPGNPLAGAYTAGSGISITVDVEMQPGSVITSLQSPSHPIGITIGSISSTQTAVQSQQPNLACATLSLGTASLDKDFVLQVMATDASKPVAILETHPTIPNQRALLTTLVPKFNLPSQRPEIVFVCDQSGSMEGQKIINLKSALQLFLKSLPVGVKFNICSFGSSHSFLFPEGSRKYDADSLDFAMRAVSRFGANYGGTELFAPIQRTFENRAKGLDLEVFVLTDGQIWNQNQLFDMVNAYQAQTQGSIRVFTLGIGDGASSALIEGLARAGNGFSQTVGDHEMLDSKVVRMLKVALTPHITDYALEIKYRKPGVSGTADSNDEFELVDVVTDLTIDGETSEAEKGQVQDQEKTQTKPILLFDPSVDLDASTDIPYNLPDVSVPRVLQSPFQIPNLFPFNRTNVYLLLSPETATKIPETVILRATSKHGPLVLEIPVSSPMTSSTGETIHQLAARKATLELEEGRGWIFHAKHKSGGLLKDALPGYSDDVVQREAVRLGVQFQVGGKWCSFVAVEDNGDGGSSPGPVHPWHDVGVNRDRNHSDIPPRRYRRTEFGLLEGKMGGGPPSRSWGSGGLFGASSSVPPPLYGRAASPASLGGPGLFGARSTSGRGGYRGGMFGASSSVPPPLYGSAASPAPFGGPGLFGASSTSGRGGYGGGMGGGRGSRRGVGMGSAMMGGGMGGFDCGRTRLMYATRSVSSNRHLSAAAPPLTHAPSLTNTLEVIVRLQSFDGFWIWSDALAVAIGVKEEDLVSQGAHLSSDAWATIAVLCFMRTKLSGDRDSWQLVADKALAWLETQAGLGSAKAVEKTIASMEVGFLPQIQDLGKESVV